MAGVSFPVGRTRLSRGLYSATQASTRDIRAQIRKLTDNVNKVMKGIKDASPEALIYAVQPIYDESQILVPVRTGRLKESGYIEARLSGDKADAVVGYARGGDPEYAVFVHENLQMAHRSPTQAKFLETPVTKYAKDIPARYAAYIRSHMGL